jgi:hypothetical protein
MLSPCGLYVFVSPYQLLNVWTNIYEPGFYIMTPELTLTAYFINLSHQSVCMCNPFSLLGHDSVKIPLSLLGNGSI